MSWIDILQWVTLWVLLIALYCLTTAHVRLSRQVEKQRAASLEPKCDSHKEPEAICGCKHHYCYHDEKGCKMVPSQWHPKTGKLVTFGCSCTGYVGPEPLPTVIP